MEIRPDPLGLWLASTRWVRSSSSPSGVRRQQFSRPGCSFGVIVARPLERCPMCGGTTWQHLPNMAAFENAKFVRA